MKITGGFHTKKEEKSDHHTRIWTRPVSVLELGWKEKLSFDARPRQLVLYTPGFHPQIQMQNLSLCEYKPFLFQYPPSRTLHAPEYLATLTPGHIRITTSPLGTMPVPQCLGVNMNIDRSQTRPVWDDKRPDCLQNGQGCLVLGFNGAAVLWQSHGSCMGMYDRIDLYQWSLHARRSAIVHQTRRKTTHPEANIIWRIYPP